MQAQRAESKSTRSIGRGVPETSNGPGFARAEPEWTKLEPIPMARTALLPLNRGASHALLTQQCCAKVEALAPRQREVLAGLAAGRSNKQIAHALGISPRTIEIYRAGVMSRLKARTLAQALYIAFVAGLVPLETMSLWTA
ncbi:MAG: hypothetical protein EOP61_02620 [Sphingomonadales bacterium]|nr:MAG: hypothetical protein EOP61_02620 [Sphingomonadales bacterium]